MIGGEVTRKGRINSVAAATFSQVFSLAIPCPATRESRRSWLVGRRVKVRDKFSEKPVHDAFSRG